MIVLEHRPDLVVEGTKLGRANPNRLANPTLSGSSGVESFTSIMTMMGTCHGFERDQSRIVLRQTFKVLHVLR
jgi:hypothetical protein